MSKLERKIIKNALDYSSGNRIKNPSPLNIFRERNLFWMTIKIPMKFYHTSMPHESQSMNVSQNELLLMSSVEI